MLARKRTKDIFSSQLMVHVDRLYSTALRLTRDPRDADDLIQDTMLSAYRFIDQFEPGSNGKAWLFKILQNTFINKYRQKRRERETSDNIYQESDGLLTLVCTPTTDGYASTFDIGIQTT